MESPPPRPNTAHSTTTRPAIPVFDLAGASRTTGGTIQGQALGNVFNHADANDITQSMLGPRVGQVHIFTEHADPTTTKPFMVLKHDITPKLGPVLKALRRKYSPVRSKSSILLLLLLIDIYILDKNQQVFLYEDDAWTIKGRYETALEDNEDAAWECENEQDLLRFLIVSKISLLVLFFFVL